MALVALRSADVLSDGARVGVPGLIHDPIQIGAALGRASNKPALRLWPLKSAKSSPAASA